jgi:methionyl-tRNA synthetase
MTKLITNGSKQQILDTINKLEIKADHYSRTDWQEYTKITQQIKELDEKLLDIFNNESEMFLQTITNEG